MGLPLDLQFRTKGQLPVDICADAFADGLRFDFICGDEAYGNCTRLRAFLEGRGQAYALRVPSNFYLTLAGQATMTCAEAAARLLKVRLYTAIARHVVLVMAALAICAVTAALLKGRTDTRAPAPVTPGQPPPAEPGMIPLTIPEIKHLLAGLLLTPSPAGHADQWLDWRRRHQARSHWYHQRARLARNAEITLVS